MQKKSVNHSASDHLSVSNTSIELQPSSNVGTESEDLKLLQIKFEQQSKKLESIQTELAKMQQDWLNTCSELQETKEELQRSQSQFDEVLAELEETHLQLHQTNDLEPVSDRLTIQRFLPALKVAVESTSQNLDSESSIKLPKHQRTIQEKP